MPLNELQCLGAPQHTITQCHQCSGQETLPQSLVFTLVILATVYCNYVTELTLHCELPGRELFIFFVFPAAAKQNSNSNSKCGSNSSQCLHHSVSSTCLITSGSPILQGSSVVPEFQCEYIQFCKQTATAHKRGNPFLEASNVSQNLRDKREALAICLTSDKGREPF